MGEPEKPTADQVDPLPVKVDGVVFPKFFETNRPMKEHIECIKALEMRDDDVILCAYPKAGTHWLWEVAAMLLLGKVEYEKRTKELAMLESNEIEKLQQLPSPRLFNTHLPAFMLPKQVKDKKVKIIHVYRNIKDVLVSGLFHSKQIPQSENITMDMILHYTFSTDINKNGNYFAFMKNMDEFVKSNPDVPVFNISYEDTKEDPVGVVTRLAEFLGVPNNPEFYQQVVDACSLERLKEAEKTKEQHTKVPHAQVYRKGVVGDWKNHLTVAQSERLDAAMKQLDGCNFRFRYTL